MGTALLYAEVRLGEMLKDNRPSTERMSVGTLKPTKWLPSGITHKQSHYAQTLAGHKEEIEAVKRYVKEEKSK